jgi:ribonuclease HI
MNKLLLYSDGGARGNPGPAASAFLATTPAGITIRTDARFIGNRTNNQAEYEALLMALRYAAEHQANEVICYLDSELVTKQLNGQYQVKNVLLHKLYLEVKTVLKHFKQVSFINVPREHPQISKADALVNQTLDKQAQKSPVSRSLSGSVFVHTCIRTSNVQRSIDFYQRFLGLQVIAKFDNNTANSELVFMQDPQGKGARLEIMFCRNQKEFVKPSFEQRLFDHLGFEVPDVYVLVSEMKQAGISVVEGPKRFDANTNIALVEDPDGTIVELIECR